MTSAEEALAIYYNHCPTGTFGIGFYMEIYIPRLVMTSHSSRLAMICRATYYLHKERHQRWIQTWPLRYRLPGPRYLTFYEDQHIHYFPFPPLE